jgi:Cathepsin propeptide inhibitor domain (I29)
LRANNSNHNFNSLQQQHNKQYNDSEDVERFEIFKKNLEMINEHNQKYERGETTFKMGLNAMTDWTEEEKKAKFGGGLRDPKEQKK